MDAKNGHILKLPLPKPSFWVSIISWKHRGCTVPLEKMNMSPEKGPFQEELSFSKHQFWGDMFRSATKTPTETRVGTTSPLRGVWHLRTNCYLVFWGPVGDSLLGIPNIATTTNLDHLFTVQLMLDISLLLRLRPKNFKTSSFREADRCHAKVDVSLPKDHCPWSSSEIFGQVWWDLLWRNLWWWIFHCEKYLVGGFNPSEKY